MSLGKIVFFYDIGGGALLHYDGITWSTISSVYDRCDGGGEIWGTGSSDVYLTGGGRLYHWDGTTLTEIPDINAMLVTGTSATDIFAYHIWGQIWHFDGTSWTSIQAAQSWGSLVDFSAGTSGRLWVAYDGKLKYWNGSNWSSKNGSDAMAFTDVWVNGTDDVYFAAYTLGNTRALMHFDGTDFETETAKNIPASVSYVSGSGSSNIYLSDATEGRVAHYNGESWESIRTDTNSLRDIWASATNDVYAVGGDTIWHYDGMTWQPMQGSFEGIALTSIWGTSTDAVYAAGSRTIDGIDQAIVLKLNGTAWSEMELGEVGSGCEVNDLIGFDSGDIFVLCGYSYSYNLLHFDGTAWAEIRPPTYQKQNKR